MTIKYTERKNHTYWWVLHHTWLTV